MFNRTAQPPPAADPDGGLARKMRRDPRINITFRLAWLMSVLSRQSGFASMGAARMAEELSATPAAIQKARQKLVKLDLFKPEGWRYRRVYLENEAREAYWPRLCAERRLDLTARAAALLANLTAKERQARLSFARAASLLGTSQVRAEWAIPRVMELGYFAYENDIGRGRGHANIYHRFNQEDGHEEQVANGEIWFDAEERPTDIDPRFFDIKF